MRIDKNKLAYYLLVFAPLLLFASYGKSLESYLFVALLGMYVFIYSPLIDYYRLRSKTVIKERSFALRFDPFLRFKYFRVLFLRS